MRKQRGGITKQLLESSNLLQYGLPTKINTATPNNNVAGLVSTGGLLKPEEIMEVLPMLEVLVATGPITLESVDHPISDVSNEEWKKVGKVVGILLMKEEYVVHWCIETIWRCIRGERIEDFFYSEQPSTAQGVFFEKILRGEQSINIMNAAAYHGGLDLLKWYDMQNYISIVISYLINIAANGGQLHIVQWLKEKGSSCKYVCEYAAQEGHMEVLHWAITNGCPYNKKQLSILLGEKVKELPI